MNSCNIWDATTVDRGDPFEIRWKIPVVYYYVCEVRIAFDILRWGVKPFLGSITWTLMMWRVLFTLLTNRQWDDILWRLGLYKWRTRDDAERPSQPKARIKTKYHSMQTVLWALIMERSRLDSIFIYIFTKCNKVLYFLDQFINNSINNPFQS